MGWRTKINKFIRFGAHRNREGVKWVVIPTSRALDKKTFKLGERPDTLWCPWLVYSPTLGSCIHRHLLLPCNIAHYMGPDKLLCVRIIWTLALHTLNELIARAMLQGLFLVFPIFVPKLVSCFEPDELFFAIARFTFSWSASLNGFWPFHVSTSRKATAQTPLLAFWTEFAVEYEKAWRWSRHILAMQGSVYAEMDNAAFENIFKEVRCEQLNISD